MAIAPHPNAEPGAYVTDDERLLFVRSYDRGYVLLEDCGTPIEDPVVMHMGVCNVSELRLVRPAPDSGLNRLPTTERV